MSKYTVTDPSTGETVSKFATFTDEEVRAGIDRADSAYRNWGRSSPLAERSALLSRVAALYRERREGLARIVVREVGKPITSALGEVDVCADIFQYYSDKAEEFLADEQLELLTTPGKAIIRRTPIGVVLGVMPWNYPYYQVARFAAPNLLLGNTILLKHASQCPESAAAIAGIFADAGYPEGAYEMLYATSAQIEDVLADPRVQGVSVTGSEAAGSAVARIAGQHLKKVVLELGGSDPFIVLSSDDLDATVECALWARFYENAGQVCCGAKRFILADEVYEPFLEKFLAALRKLRPSDPAKPDTLLGPVSSVAAADFLADQLNRAVASGARVALGGGRHGAFVEPTVLVDIAPGNEAAREEFFGPFAHVYRVASEEEAIAVANDTPFGLGAYVFSADQEQALRVADRIDAGMVSVNTFGGEGPEVPFGGTKRSGFGRELGRFGLDEFANRKLIRTGV
ncbi:succinate-semialdehyde dehydrogenase [Amycolatopsis deserti]|uniref:Succinate-semialdehyde dehydrogenase n=1 Tax=Amycolatopsis deserti TaxID=185696 RepID=A0ABQ3IMM7_9PSEU|nr:NAD-dependent succinate-semialdehyde dehydrogenase [Amycolatopsis deserti]GHE88769.1 succinate-semialdehyde dehydrogenase [Amycolatopsis deserti]